MTVGPETETITERYRRDSLGPPVTVSGLWTGPSRSQPVPHKTAVSVFGDRGGSGLRVLSRRRRPGVRAAGESTGTPRDPPCNGRCESVLPRESTSRAPRPLGPSVSSVGTRGPPRRGTVDTPGSVQWRETTRSERRTGTLLPYFGRREVVLPLLGPVRDSCPAHGSRTDRALTRSHCR